MSEVSSVEATPEKPASSNEVYFPPFPVPTDDDFEDDISQEERDFYKNKYADLNLIKTERLHCTACDKHLGCAPRNDPKMRVHPMLRTLMCQGCHAFYNSGEFEKGDDGSELYCRWCGQGGQVYCCSDCQHVFCAKCIKRNLGLPKIKEIENTDDWKCFKCNPKCLWDLRARCWAVSRYCDLKHKMSFNTTDSELKDKYIKDCSIDYSECCKNKNMKRKLETTKKKDSEVTPKRSTPLLISKISPSIQVKKFASMVDDDALKQEKKAVKRSASPKEKGMTIKTPRILPTPQKILNPINISPLPFKMQGQPGKSNFKYINIESNKKNPISYPRMKTKPIMNMSVPIMTSSQYNGLNIGNDNINLSLESLTQGLDITSVTGISNTTQKDDVVCTPDLPLEPICEMMEDNDDDVECITPGPVAAPKSNAPPPLIPRTNSHVLPELTSDNIIQMTENDVTVNAATGGLKFRVDPQTLSSKKMYRLPDGRIFAINANPHMPGGYSATIVAVTDSSNSASKTMSKGITYAAKLSAVSTQNIASQLSRSVRSYTNIRSVNKRKNIETVKMSNMAENVRECDLNVPIEWFRYNLIDALDAVEYSLPKLQKLNKDCNSIFLRTRTPNEMKNLHRTLDRLLNTSATRLKEIRENLNKDLEKYLSKKSGNFSSDEDDDVEILSNINESDDPIFVDENSVDMSMNENQEVDLTGREHNSSGEKSNEGSFTNNTCKDPLSSEDINVDKNGKIFKGFQKDSLINGTGNKIASKGDILICKEVMNEDQKLIKSNQNSNSLTYTETVNQDHKNSNDMYKIKDQDIVEAHDSLLCDKDNSDTSQTLSTDQKATLEQDDLCDKEKEAISEGTNNQKTVEAQDSLSCDKATKGDSSQDNNTDNQEIKVQNSLDENSNGDKSRDITLHTDKVNKNCSDAEPMQDEIDNQDTDEKMNDAEMSDEMIKNLLGEDDAVEESHSNSENISEIV